MKQIFGYILCIMMLCSATEFAHSQNFKIETSSGNDTLEYPAFISVGDTAKGWVKITNISAVDDTISINTFQNGTVDYFDVNGILGSSISIALTPNESKKIDLEFIGRLEKTQFGVTTAQYAITNENNLAYSQKLSITHKLSPIINLGLDYPQIDIQMEFNNIKPTVKTCTPLYIVNPTPYPAVITDVYDQFSFIFTVAPNFLTPVVILPGEKIEYGTVCYRPREANEYDNDKSYDMSISINNERKIVVLRFLGTSTRDTILLQQCFYPTFDSSIFGPVLLGGSVNRTIRIKSNRYFPLSINKDIFFWGDSDSFSVVGDPFPIVIPPFGIDSFQIKFSPNIVSPSNKYRYTTNTYIGSRAGTESCPMQITIVGVAIAQTPENIAQSILAPSTSIRYIAMTSPNAIFSHTFKFYNNQSKDIRIKSIALKNSPSEFTITKITPSTSAFMLAAGDSITVTITLNTSSFDVVYNQLFIETDLSSQPIVFHLQGLRTDLVTAVHQTKTHTPVNISVSPNPSTGEVFINATGIKSSTIEIFDVLGNRVHEQIGNECHWSAINTGTYFARVTGYSEDGEPFVESKQILITR